MEKKKCEGGFYKSSVFSVKAESCLSSREKVGNIPYVPGFSSAAEGGEGDWSNTATLLQILLSDLGSVLQCQRRTQCEGDLAEITVSGVVHIPERYRQNVDVGRL